MSIIEPVLETCKQAIQPFMDNFLLKAFLATVGVATGYLFGAEFYNLVWVVVWLVVLDTITGLWSAKISGEIVSSKRFIHVVPKLLRYLTFIAAAHLLQSVIPINIYAEQVVVIFLATTEFISVTENLGKAGMPVPQKLLNKINEIRDSQ